jgi:hypothetical protein
MAARRSKAKSSTLFVDKKGLLMDAIVHGADLQGRDDGVLLMATFFGVKLYADAGYPGPKLQQGLARVCRAVNVELVRRCDIGKFVVLPKRWDRTASDGCPKTWNASTVTRWRACNGHQCG